MLLQLLQPLPRKNLFPMISAFVRFSSIKDSSDGSYSSLHEVHIFRTNLWLMTASRVEAIKYGLTPISIKRVTVVGASLVCSVLKTKCPVNEACIAILAVSSSRISPTRMISGSCLKIALKQRAKSTPIDVFICT